MKQIIFIILSIILFTTDIIAQTGRPSCKDFKVTISKDPRTNPTTGGCCYNIAITNMFKGQLVYAPKSFGIGLSNAAIISCSPPPSGWSKTPANIPPATNNVTWTAAGVIPYGQTNLGTFCIGNIKKDPFYITWQWFDSRRMILCKDSVLVSCRKDSNKCCQFGLRLFDNVPNTFKSIKIVPLNPADILNVDLGPDDMDNWTLTNTGSGASYIFSYINGMIPANSSTLIDAGFTINANPNVNNPKIRVLWIDGSGITQKTEEIILACKSEAQLSDENFQYDWRLNTATIGTSFYTDTKLFAGAEAQLCVQAERGLRDINCTDITASVPFCVGNQLTVTLSATDISSEVPSARYDWVVDGIQFPGQGLSFSTPLTGTDQTSATVTVNVVGLSSTGTDSVYCTQSINVPYCKPAAEFIASKPQVRCDNSNNLLGWDVTLNHVTSCTNIVSYTWDFGDGSAPINGSGPINDAAHLYATAGTYTAKLKISDAYGCTDTRTQKITISATCDPQFHINYEWCDYDTIKKDKKYQIKVTLTNQSVSFCSSTYKWDYGDGTTGVSNEHIYNTYPNQAFTISLTMKDNKVCPGGVTVKHTFNLKPVHNGLKVIACPDGIVKFYNDADKVTWKLPNWQALTSDPAYYCLPSPFDPLLNIQINAFLGLLGTSLPQAYVNLFNKKYFELRFKDGAAISTTCTSKEDQGDYATGTCTITKSVVVHITCCLDNFNTYDYRYKTINGKDYRMKIRFKTHYRERHGVPGPGACIDFYLSSIIPEATHLMARTVFQRKRTVPGLGWTYYLISWADVISTGVTGSFLSNGGVFHGCNCAAQVQWDQGKSRNYRLWLTYRDNTPGLYRVDKNGSLHSYHHIEKNGVQWDEYIEKPVGACKP